MRQGSRKHLLPQLGASLGEEDRITYFCDQKECDFVVQRGERVSELIQVCWALNEENLEREVGGLLAASSAFTGCRQCRILTFNQQQTIERDGIRIEVLHMGVMIESRKNILSLRSVCDNHTEFEYIFFEVLLVYSIVLEDGTVVIYGLWRIRQDAGNL